MSVMLRVQEVLFFGEEHGRDGRFFLPKVNKASGRYVAVGIQIVLFSLIISAALAFVLLVVINHFLPLGERAGLFFAFGTLVLCPYFLVRFILKLPAAAADRPLRWWKAWRMTTRIHVVIALVQVVFLVVPLMVFLFIDMMLQNIFANTPFILFLMNYSVVLAVLFASILHAAYSGYLFSLLSSQE